MHEDRLKKKLIENEKTDKLSRFKQQIREAEKITSQIKLKGACKKIRFPLARTFFFSKILTYGSSTFVHHVHISFIFWVYLFHTMSFTEK